MTAPDIHLIQMTHSTVTRGHGYISELHVHVVFGFEELSAVDLAVGDFEGDYMALGVNVSVDE